MHVSMRSCSTLLAPYSTGTTALVAAFFLVLVFMYAQGVGELRKQCKYHVATPTPQQILPQQ
jgi:hypothetical protein